MSMPPYTKPQNTKERILSSAFELFAERGYEGTTTKKIATLAGVNEVTIFRAFGSKEGLFQKVIDEKLPLRKIQTVVGFDPDRPVQDMLVENARTVLEILKQNRHYFMMLVGEVWKHPEIKEQVRVEFYGRAIRFLAGQLQILMNRGSIRPVDPIIASKVLLGMVQSYYLFNYLIGPGNIDPDEEERTLRGLIDIFYNGIGNQERG